MRSILLADLLASYHTNLTLSSLIARAVQTLCKGSLDSLEILPLLIFIYIYRCIYDHHCYCYFYFLRVYAWIYYSSDIYATFSIASALLWSLAHLRESRRFSANLSLWTFNTCLFVVIRSGLFLVNAEETKANRSESNYFLLKEEAKRRPGLVSYFRLSGRFAVFTLVWLYYDIIW